MAEVITLPPEELIQDQETLSIKHTLMESMKKSDLLNSVSKFGTFIAGLMLAAGMAIIGNALKTATLSTFLPLVAAQPVGLTFLAVAAVATIAAVTSDYMGSRIYHGSCFDQTEFKAKDTAKHLVAALKENNMCLKSEHEDHCRGDGKKWVDVVRQQPPTPQVQ